jgi:hypothetical protein
MKVQRLADEYNIYNNSVTKSLQYYNYNIDNIVWTVA